MKRFFIGLEMVFLCPRVNLKMQSKQKTNLISKRAKYATYKIQFTRKSNNKSTLQSVRVKHTIYIEIE